MTVSLVPRLVLAEFNRRLHSTAQVLEQLEMGASLALVSDAGGYTSAKTSWYWLPLRLWQNDGLRLLAGTPAISDPGSRIISAAIAAGHRVIPLPGASAALAALVASGLPADDFRFLGFLPPKSGARRKRLQQLAGELLRACTLYVLERHDTADLPS
jgi:16S rRNA C1402 (ribose-2'-O) methylase RsmI